MDDKFLLKKIGKSIADKMTKKYKEKARMVADDKFPFLKRDTQSLWISRDNFEKFFSTENKSANGVRIYLGITGKYKGENGDDDYECREDYHNQTNLIFVPTTSDGKTPTMSNSRNMINESDKSTLIVLGGRIEDDMEMCPPETSTTKCPEII